LEAKIRDVVGLYLDPPGNAVMVSADEKSQIQALDRTAPLLPMCFGQAGKCRESALGGHHTRRM